jgi:ATP-dependent DNA ligase
MRKMSLSLLYRYPDIPNQIGPETLATFARGEWLAQLKYNGFRAMYEWDGRGTLLIWGRHGTQLKEPSPQFRERTVEWMRKTRLPACVIDGEYMGRRDQAQGVTERSWLFDLLMLDGNWLGNEPTDVRWEMLRRHVPAEEVPASATERFAEFFEYSRGVQGCEGIVLKKTTARFFGSVRECFENPNWFKCKWRGGEDGNLPLC